MRHDEAEYCGLIEPVSDKPKVDSQNSLFSILEEIDEGTSNGTLLEEFNNYTKEKIEEESCDPLEYWKSNKQRFPFLSQLARRVFSIPASSGSVERLFSIAGAIARARRAKISLERVEMLIMNKEASTSST